MPVLYRAGQLRNGVKRALEVRRGGTLVWREPSSATAAVRVATSSAVHDTLYSTTSAAVYDSVSNKTFIAFNGLGRACYVNVYDHATATMGTAALVANSTVGSSDNHGAPSITIAPDGTLCVVFGNHNAPYRFARSTSPRDHTTWTLSTLPFDSTYNSLRVDPATGDLLMFYRSGTTHGTVFPCHEFTAVSRSTDKGTTWQAAVPIIDTTATPEAASDPYVYDVVPGPDGRMWLAWSIARGNLHDGQRINFHVAAWNPSTGTWTNAAGTDLGATITFAKHRACLVAYGGAQGEAGVIRLAFSPATGRPWVSYVWGAGDPTDPNLLTGYPYVAHFDGTQWVTEFLGVQTAWVYAFPAMRFNGTRPEVYVPGLRPAGDTTSSLFKFARKDGGAWQAVARVAAGTPGGVGIERAQVFPGSREDAAILFSENTQATRGSIDPTTSDKLSPIRAASVTQGEGAAVPTLTAVTEPARSVTFADDFTRADTTGNAGNGWLSSSSTHTVVVTGNQLATTATSTGTYWGFQDATKPVTADQYAQAQVTAFPGVSTTPHPSVAVRYIPQTGANPVAGVYYARWNPTGTRWELYKTLGATVTLIASVVDTAPTVGYTIRLEARGDLLTLKVGGVTKVTGTDTEVPDGYRCGVGFRRTAVGDLSMRVDNFACGDLT